MMVTAVVAVASVMGVALLASSALQSEATSNHVAGVQAYALAESGINLGLYYLQNVNDNTKSPVGIVSYPGGGVGPYPRDLGTNVPGSFEIKFIRLTSTQYQVISTGTVPSASAGAVTRTLTANVDVNYFTYGLTASNANNLLGFTIPNSTTINGDVYVTCAVTNNGTVTGTIYAPNGSLLGGLLGGVLRSLTTALGLTPVPTTASVNHYAPRYTYNGVQYNAKTITTTADIPATPDPNTNPGGVYVASATLDVAGNTKINGTIVITPSGALRVAGTNNTITPVPGFPAVVVDGDITYKTGAALEIRGLTYVGGKINHALLQTGGTLKITGTLLFASTSPSIDTGIQVTVTYDRVKASVPTLVGANPPPCSVTVASWQDNPDISH